MRLRDQIFHALHTLEHFLSSETKSAYYTQSVLAILLGFLFSNLSRFLAVKFLIIGIGFLVGFYFYKQASNLLENLPDDAEEDDSFDPKIENFLRETVNYRTINTSGGNYNERIEGTYIQGDYIEIQGYPIDINRDVSEIAQQLRQIQTQLQQQGISGDRVASYIIDDLKNQMHHNSRFKEILFQWTRELGNYASRTQVNEIKAAEALIEYTFSFPKQLLSDSITVVDEGYEQLYELLQENRWDEADIETARLVFELSNKDFEVSAEHLWFSSQYNLSARDIEMVPGRDLNLINALWFKSSNGHFGFSVQKRLWQKNINANIYNCLEEFGNSVGWRIDGDWIYYSDLSYLSSVPAGHLPALVMMPRWYSGYTTCQPDEDLFTVFMKRTYIL